MTASVVDINGVGVLLCPKDGVPLGSEQDALDLIGMTYGEEVALVAVPVARMMPQFFRLRSGLLGAFVQKLQNYRLRLAFIGDLSAAIAQSTALRDFVYESNRGGHVLFVGTMEELEARL